MKFFREIEVLLDQVESKNKESVKEAAELLSQSIMSGGILQSFGSGHSVAGALEITERAGGLIPSKLIREPSGGLYETIEGVGEKFVEKIDIRPEDIVFIISNSGRNPLVIELAAHVKKIGASLVVVTALDVSKSFTSRHSSGKLLYEFADVVLDNCTDHGDAALEVDGLAVKVCGTSSVAAAALLQQVVYEAIELMVAADYQPPVYMSFNVDGGLEYSKKMVDKYAERIHRL